MPRKSAKPRKSGGPTKASKPAKRGTSSRSSKRSDTGVARPESVDATRDATARKELLASDKLYYRIGEVSRLTSVKAHVLRYWETEFRWMAPPKSRSKQRLYRKRDIEFVWLLKRLLWEERYTIAGARQRVLEVGVDEALALLDQPVRIATSDAASVPEGSARTSHSEWVSFRGALDEMERELRELQGVLQEGA